MGLSLASSRVQEMPPAARSPYVEITTANLRVTTTPHADGRPSGGVSGLPLVRMARWRVRTIPVRRVPDRAPGRVLVQDPRVLSELRRPAHDRARRSPGGPRHPGCPGSTVGLDAAAPPPVPGGLAPRPVQGRGARAAAGGASASAHPRPRARPCRCAQWRRGDCPTIRRGAESERAHPRASARRRVRERRRRAPALPCRTRVGRRGCGRRAGRDCARGARRYAGCPPRRVGQSVVGRGEPALGACHARWEGFDLHAAVRVPAGPRDRLERVCRYARGGGVSAQSRRRHDQVPQPAC